MSFLKDLRIKLLLSTVVFIVLGVLMLVVPDKSGDIICLILSIAAIIGGITLTSMFFKEVAKGDPAANGLVSGVLLLAAGIYFLINKDDLKNVLGIILGFVVLAGGLAKLQQGFKIKKLGAPNWKFSMFLSAVGIVLGIVILVFSNQDIIPILIGISLLVSGTIDLVLFFQTVSASKSIGEAAPEEQNKTEN